MLPDRFVAHEIPQSTLAIFGVYVPAQIRRGVCKVRNKHSRVIYARIPAWKSAECPKRSLRNGCAEAY
jgi:hypothetical protein